MARSFTGKKRLRRSFGRHPEIIDMPNLIELQRGSFEYFLQQYIDKDQRADTGLQAVLKELFPISDGQGRLELHFKSYHLLPPKFEIDECLMRDATYAAVLKLSLEMTVWNIDPVTGEREFSKAKEQDVVIGEIPLMTSNGTFIVNGTERVIVSQMHRSPGVFFDHDRGKTHSSGKLLYAARIIPYRGSWVDFEFDHKDILHVRIDRRKKIPVTTLLAALPSDSTLEKISALKTDSKEWHDLPRLEWQGMSRTEILQFFYDRADWQIAGDGFLVPLLSVIKRPKMLEINIYDNHGEVLLKAGETPSQRVLNDFFAKQQMVKLPKDNIYGRYMWQDVILPNGLVLAEAGDEISEELLEKMIANGASFIPTLDIDFIEVGPYIRNTLMVDKMWQKNGSSRENALEEIYKLIRVGETPTYEQAEYHFQNLFFESDRYDLSSVGRFKINSRLELDEEESPDVVRVLRKKDLLAIIKSLCATKDGRGEVDDIDHLGNRRVRAVGELLENQYRMGFLKMERFIREKMQQADIERVMPQELINAKPLNAVIREFFGSSQLSQFMDQTNPLAEITHKRRLSALGPGGLTRDRAGFEVRDIHPTHYGRICPIETPEGQNIGLINSLATFASVNHYGFIETPYRKVVGGVVQNDIIFMSAMEESKYTIAQADARQSDDKKLLDELVPCRHRGDYVLANPQDIDYIDVSPKQLVSVAAALIPFLENDDANRALMGSNMQRQAVPLLRNEAPLVGTGMEERVAYDSGVVIVAKRPGVVDQVDAKRIVIRVTEDVQAGESSVDIYPLKKYKRSNQSTCINQRPLAMIGDVVKKGDIIADGPSTDLGELALGQNALVAFMPWNGYNFEDSILISERIVRDDVFSSIHIEEFEIAARDTKLGPEVITRDIPNVTEEALRNLDEAGMIYIGADVVPGDILVGKVTPKGETQVTPEEKLLRAIFGEKASDMRDTSLRVPPGVQGTIVEVRVFSRRGMDKDERAISIERSEIESLTQDREDERKILERAYRLRFLELAKGQKIKSGSIKGDISEAVVEKTPATQLCQVLVSDAVINSQLEDLKKWFQDSHDEMGNRFESKVTKVKTGDDLSPGILKTVKVFIAVKRKLQPGDKMAGRHGNKGVISRIVPMEDMPHLEDGTAVDIVLNPLGVPSRMNVGQIMETHLGWACHGLGHEIAIALKNYKQEKNIERLKATLINVYQHNDMEKVITSMNVNQTLELANNTKSGIPVATPVFDGARIAEIDGFLSRAGLDASGQARLIDGRTGEFFVRPVTVGYIYMIKLHHLVDDKIHARSVGPYSLVTQQPLGGKAQFGGQRFGEMEVWALEAYGAAYTLQEILTVKSDDVAGRGKVYKAIVEGNDSFEIGIPESFNVLIKELQALGLSVELLQDHQE
ncbi:MAG: DNA-directed RNA polymerase subunit beta [Alphaproteobacteria bacterium]